MKQRVVSKQARFNFHGLRAHRATQHKVERGTLTLPELHKNPQTTAQGYKRKVAARRSAQ